MRILGLAFVVVLSGCAGADDEPNLGGGTPSSGTSDASTGVSTASTGSSSGSGTSSDSAGTGGTGSTDSGGTTSTGGSGSTGQGQPSLPPANGSLDYQLGGAYDPPAGVTVLSRDRKASPYAGIYNICYVNGYQTQPDEEQWWIDNHYDLLLKDSGGEPFIDPDWDEILLDITTQSKRDALAAIVGGWIQQCADDGFDAVEIDNLDTYSRSDGLITQDNAVQFMSLLSATAHGAEIAIAQKNSTEIADRQAEMGTDFVVAEECNRWSECDDYKAVYGDLVFVIEYRQQDFDAGCSGYPELSIVLRDLNLVTPGNGSYVYDGC